MTRMRLEARAPAAKWLRRPGRERGRGPGLVCFPYAGGSASAFRGLSGLVRTELDPVAVQYPGRQDRLREPPRTDVHVLAGEITEVLLTLPEPERRFLFGHSLGASVAFEVARRLEAAGTGPRALVVSGRRAPCRPRDSRVHEDSDADLIAEIHRLGGGDPRMWADADLVRTMLPTVRADLAAAECYRPEPGAVVSCSITVFAGSADTEVTVEEARAWAGHTTGRCAVRLFPGGHFYIDDQLPAVARALVTALAAGA